MNRVVEIVGLTNESWAVMFLDKLLPPRFDSREQARKRLFDLIEMAGLQMEKVG